MQSSIKKKIKCDLNKKLLASILKIDNKMVSWTQKDEASTEQNRILT